jgi:hypothetical protein
MPARPRWIIIGAVLFIAAMGLAGAGLWIGKSWPFTRAAITQTLEQRFGRQVLIGQFRQTWFPPGCVAGDVHVASLGSAQNLIVKTGWADLLRRHLEKIKVVGLRITIALDNPPAVPGIAAKSSVSSVGEIEANETVLEFLPQAGDSGKTTIQVHQLVLDHVAAGQAIAFQVSLKAPKLAGVVNVQGNVGPWNTNNAAATPISGIYQFADADLKVFRGLGGILSSAGKFSGNLSNIKAEGSIDVPRFHVDDSAHSADLTAQFRASVDTRTADTVIQNAEAHLGRTIILSTGNISGGNGTEGKTARLQMAVDTGRVEDLLNYFSHERHPSMTGDVRLRAYVEVPPGPGFLRKIRLNGDFGVAGGKFTTPTRQTPVNRLSESARGEKKAEQEEDPKTVLSNLKGHVVIRDGTASLQKLSFGFPGAFAEMTGLYNLIPKTVDIHGTLRTEGTLSDASLGFKALLLKVATPFLKKSRTTVVPFVITGKASNPSVDLDLRKKVKL